MGLRRIGFERGMRHNQHPVGGAELGSDFLWCRSRDERLNFLAGGAGKLSRRGEQFERNRLDGAGAGLDMNQNIAHRRHPFTRPRSASKP